MDVAVADSYSNVISILFGNGDGSFQPPVNTVLGPTLAIQGISAADFNGDGNLDLLISYCDSSTGNGAVQVYLGDGTGTFRPGVQFPVPHACGSPIYVLAADPNGDKKADIVFAPWGAFALTVALGNGDGSFQNPSVYPIESVPDAPPLLADVNHDGIPDLVVATNGLSVLLGNGDGTFRPYVYTNVFTGVQISSLAVGDFDSDGNADAAVWAGSTLILLGNGDGTFQPPRSYATSSSFSLNSGDFNSDGTADLLVAGDVTNGNAPAVGLFLSSPLTDYFPSFLDFSSQEVGVPSATQTVALTNIGSALCR